MSQNTSGHVSKQSHQEYVYQLLKERILFCELLPGTQIVESDLCEQYRVSRTPVREALLRLMREGFVVIEQRKSTHVSKISLKEVRDTMMMRLYIEPRVLRDLEGAIGAREREQLLQQRELFSNAIRKCSSASELREFLRMDYDFHTLLVSMSGNQVIARHSDELFSQSMRYWYFMFVTMRSRTEQSIKEHIEIIDKLLEGDCAGAAELLEQHIKKSSELECFS